MAAVPKRTEERRRVNNENGQMDTDRPKVEGSIVIPVAKEYWHEIAKDWYNSLAESGQSIYYEPSDWATAVVLAETLSRELKPQQVFSTDAETGEQSHIWVTMPIKGASLTAILKGMTALLTTEGERRRMRMEIERKGAAEAASKLPKGVANISDRRAAHFA